ncbi:MAG: hypothetical protein ACKVWV_03500 [Planctomycetota bacterium]
MVLYGVAARGDDAPSVAAGDNRPMREPEILKSLDEVGEETDQLAVRRYEDEEREDAFQIWLGRREDPAAVTGYKPDKERIWRFAKEHILEQIRTPGTAKWPDDGWVSGFDVDDAVSYWGNRKYEVNSWIDAENGFGALIRRKFFFRVFDGESGMFVSGFLMY